jgi:PAS domain S-box-containing protein
MYKLNQIITQVPNCIFWKDKNSVFLGANEHFAYIAGLCSVIDVKGKTDYTMPWGKTHADLYRMRDKEIINTAIAAKQIETQLRANGKLVTVIVHKAPLLDNKGKVIGVIGSFIELPNGFDNSHNHISIPPSQQAVLTHVVQGLSAKEIAKKLNLSQRTIEFYTVILKKKFSCRSKSELITKAWQLGFICA